MLIHAEPLTKLVARIFAAAGCDDETADCLARHLVDSNLCGHDSHGVLRVLRYVGYVEAKTVNPQGRMKIIFTNGALTAIDGEMGFGQVVAEAAMEVLAVAAHEHGIAMATVRNCGHVGRLGDWAEQLAHHGLVSLHFLNTTGIGMHTVPFGGSDARLSINPLSICVPREGSHPILLDMTTTMVAEGKLAVARNKGMQVAPGAIVDKHGQPTTDPDDFYDGGAMLPIAGHKGSGLNILTDLLAGLSGGGCTAPGVKTLVNTMTSIAINPARLPDTAAYVAEVERFAIHVAASPPREPGGAVLLPGDVEHQTRVARQRDGIPLDDNTWSQILETGRKASLTDDEMQKLSGQPV